MGKKSLGLTGLSRFVLDAFKDNQEDPQPSAACTFYSATPNINVSTGKTRPTPEEPEVDDRPSKKRKTGLLGPGWEKYDATGIVPHYRNAFQVPDALQKYFSQRKRYFSLYENGCLLDDEGWYSVTPERVADQIAERCRCATILDAFCGVGGNAIAFAKTCERVIALDTSPVRLALARHNAIIYGVADRIEFILTDYISFSRSYLSLPSQQRKIDVVFLSPPWGGPSYLSGSPVEALSAAQPKSTERDSNVADETIVPVEAHPEYNLSSIQPIHGAELFKLSRRITPNIAYFLPRNTKLEDISALLQDTSRGDKGEQDGQQNTEQKDEVVEVEEEWMGTKLKALTCYFGGLVGGQEDLF